MKCLALTISTLLVAGSAGAAGASAPPLRPRATVTLAGEARGLALAGGSLWVSIPADGVVLRLDPGSGRTRARVDPRRFDRRAFAAGALAAGAGAVWVATPVHVDDEPGLEHVSGWIARLDPSSGAMRISLVRGDAPSAVAAGAEGVWVAGGKTLRRVDRRTGRVAGSVSLGRDLGGVAVGHGAVWVGAPRAGLVLRIDPATRHVVARIRVGHMPGGGSISAGALVWAATADGVAGIDPRTNRVFRRLRVARPNAVAASGATVWIYSPDGLWSAGASGGATQRARFAADGRFGELAVADDGIWISDGASSTLSRYG